MKKKKKERKKTSDQPESQWLLWLSNDGWRNRRSQKRKESSAEGSRVYSLTCWGRVYHRNVVGWRSSWKPTEKMDSTGFLSFLDSDRHTHTQETIPSNSIRRWQDDRGSQRAAPNNRKLVLLDRWAQKPCDYTAEREREREGEKYWAISHPAVPV